MMPGCNPVRFVMALGVPFVLASALPMPSDNTVTADASITSSTYCLLAKGQIDLGVRFTVASKVGASFS